MKNRLIAFLKRYKSIFILLFFLLLIAAVNPRFFRMGNLRNLFLKVSIQGIIGFGMTFTLIAGEFDMSVGSILTLSGIMFATLLPITGFFAAFCITIAAGVVMGIINGTLVARLRLSSFIATLGMQYVYKAIALMISQGNPVRISDPIAVAISGFKIGGSTVFPFLFILVGLISAYILRMTKLGRNIYATGGNTEVAANSGINVKYYKVISFVIVCAASALAGILMSIRLQSATTIAGDDTSLTVVSSAIIGGTSPAGGVGGALETFIGLLIIGVITSNLDLLGISGYYQQVVQGLLTVAIIGATSYSNYRKTNSV